MHPAPASTSEHARIFRAPVLFEAMAFDATSIAFDAEAVAFDAESMPTAAAPSASPPSAPDGDARPGGTSEKADERLEERGRHVGGARDFVDPRPRSHQNHFPPREGRERLAQNEDGERRHEDRDVRSP